MLVRLLQLNYRNNRFKDSFNISQLGGDHLAGIFYLMGDKLAHSYKSPLLYETKIYFREIFLLDGGIPHFLLVTLPSNAIVFSDIIR